MPQTDTMGQKFFGISTVLNSTLKEHLLKDPIKCEANEANNKIINHFNELKKLTFKLQRVRESVGNFKISRR